MNVSPRPAIRNAPGHGLDGQRRLPVRIWGVICDKLGATRCERVVGFRLATAHPLLCQNQIFDHPFYCRTTPNLDHVCISNTRSRSAADLRTASSSLPERPTSCTRTMSISGLRRRRPELHLLKFSSASHRPRYPRRASSRRRMSSDGQRDGWILLRDFSRRWALLKSLNHGFKWDRVPSMRITSSYANYLVLVGDQRDDFVGKCPGHILREYPTVVKPTEIPG